MYRKTLTSKELELSYKKETAINYYRIHTKRNLTFGGIRNILVTQGNFCSFAPLSAPLQQGDILFKVYTYKNKIKCEVAQTIEF